MRPIINKIKLLLISGLAVLMTARAMGAQQWAVFETSFASAKTYDNPFTDVEVDVVFRTGDQDWVVPAFWAGGNQWTVRFAPPIQGNYTYQVRCSDPANRDLNGKEKKLRVAAYTGDDPLLQHGFVRVSSDQRHFEYATAHRSFGWAILGGNVCAGG